MSAIRTMRPLPFTLSSLTAQPIYLMDDEWIPSPGVVQLDHRIDPRDFSVVGGTLNVIPAHRQPQHQAGVADCGARLQRPVRTRELDADRLAPHLEQLG